MGTDTEVLGEKVYQRVGYLNEDARLFPNGAGKYIHYRRRHHPSLGTCADDSPPIENLKKGTKIIVFIRGMLPNGTGEAFKIKIARYRK